LFFPIFLIIIAGLVEVSHLVITQNRVSNAARIGARFGANGGEDDGITLVALNAVTQTMELDEERWDMWVVRGTVNDDGTGFTDWEFEHAYGLSRTEAFSNVNESEVQQQVLEELQTDQFGSSNPAIAGGLRVVGAYLIYDAESILGLDAMPGLIGFNSIEGLNVMRVTGLDIEQTNGCSAFPIAVHVGGRSVTPPDSGGNPYPQPNQFDYPDPPPSYESFINHVPDVPITEAKEGYVYKVQNGFGEGNFGWLLWNEGRPSNAGSLAGSIGWPGDSNDYTNHGDNQIYPAADEYPWIVRGYVEPGDPTDTSLHVGDWVAANTGSVNANAVRDAVAQHVDRERTLRLIVWEEAQQQGTNGQYRIYGFAIFRLHGYHLSQGQGGSWILGEFIRWDESCGQVSETP
jgi:hypothetical protein